MTGAVNNGELFFGNEKRTRRHTNLCPLASTSSPIAVHRYYEDGVFCILCSIARTNRRWLLLPAVRPRSLPRRAVKIQNDNGFFVDNGRQDFNILYSGINIYINTNSQDKWMTF